jgi:hypothetical protein
MEADLAGRNRSNPVIFPTVSSLQPGCAAAARNARGEAGPRGHLRVAGARECRCWPSLARHQHVASTARPSSFHFQVDAHARRTSGSPTPHGWGSMGSRAESSYAFQTAGHLQAAHPEALEEWDGLPGRVTKEKTTGPGSYYQLGSRPIVDKAFLSSLT